MMSKPVKTSIASIDGKKIMKLEDALKIRDNPKIKVQKGLEITYKEDFDSLWEKYINVCKYELKLAYNTLLRKEKMYNKYLKGNFTKKIQFNWNFLYRVLTSVNRRQASALLQKIP